MSWTEPTEANPEERGPGMEGMVFQKLTGTRYPCVLQTDDWPRQMDIVRNLILKDDDIIFLSKPRSGNHWTFEIVSMIINQKVQYDADHFADHLVEFGGPQIQEMIDKYKSPRTLTMHAKVDKIPDEILRRGNKIIYLLRNPKDVWVSEFYTFSKHPDPRCKYTGTWDEFYQRHMEDKFVMCSWFDHVLAMEDFMERHPQHPVYVSLYERMKENPKDAVKELCHFLDRPDTLVDEIVEATEFKTMAPVLIKGKMVELEKTLREQSHTEGEQKTEEDKSQSFLVRKGVIGDWKNWFTQAQSEAFNKLFREKMPADSKMAKMVMPYLDL